MPPSEWTPITRILAQQFVRPREHAAHTPQVMYGLTAQRSPGLKSPSLAAFQYFDRQFVPQNSWVAEKGLRAFEGMEIGAADADGQDAHQRLARPGSRGLRRSVSVNRPGCSNTMVFIKHQL